MKLRVRNIAQKVLWEQELSGQISDGQWENSGPRDHWKPWTSCEVVVDPDNVGRDFYARRESYNFTARDLLAVVQDRMLEYVRRITGDANYSERDLKRDLNDLKVIIKQHVPGPDVLPVPVQPKTYKAVLSIDGYPQEYRLYVKTESDPAAVAILEKREQEGRAYRLKRTEEEIAKKAKELAKLEADAAVLREQLGVLV